MCLRNVYYVKAKISKLLRKLGNPQAPVRTETI